MRFHRNRSHVIDLIFPLAVLFVFAASSLVVLILSVQHLHRTDGQAEAHYRTDTPHFPTLKKRYVRTMWRAASLS